MNQIKFFLNYLTCDNCISYEYKCNNLMFNVYLTEIV